MKLSFTLKDIALYAGIIIPITLISITIVSGKREACRQELKEMLRDPSSLEIDWGGIEQIGDRVFIDYRARNGFGGMVSNTFSCKFDEKGNIIYSQ